MSKLIPWIIAVAATLGLIGSHFYYRDVVARKDTAIAEVESKLAALDRDSQAKVQALSARAATAEQRASEVSAEAVAKVQQIAEEASTKVQEVSAEAAAKLDAARRESNARVEAASKPDTTVSVTFRKAILASGLVAGFRNTSKGPIEIGVTAVRPSTRQERQYRMVLDAQQAKEIGEREGWAFLPGDTVLVTQPEHKPKMASAQ